MERIEAVSSQPVRIATLLVLSAIGVTLPAQLPSPEASFPGRQPVIATNGKTVGLVVGRDDGVYFARSADGGRSFSEPVRVVHPATLALGLRRGPRIAMTAGAIVISAIVGERGGGADGDLVAWRSTDEGRTWSSGVRVNDVVGSAREGLHDLAAGGSGLLAAAWLDLRSQGTRIYTAISADGGSTWSTNRLAYESPTGSVCQCCHPSLAITPTGEIAVMFRNEIRPETAASDAPPVRDMYLARTTRDGSFAPAVKLGRGSWPLAACPMDGGDLAFDAKGNPLTIWRRDADIFLARPGQAEQRLAAGKNPVLAMTRTAGYAAWMTNDALVVQDLTGQAIATIPGARWPVLLPASDDSILLAYERDGQSFVRVIKARDS
jgi:hypothetical protein